MLLLPWDIQVVWLEGDTDVAAEMTPNLRYRSGKLALFPKFWVMSRDEQEHVIIHELLHIITGHQQQLVSAMQKGMFVSEDEAQAQYEFETSWITQIIDKLRANL